jgi:hypothetical protein
MSMPVHAHPVPLESTLAGPALYGATSMWWLVQTIALYGPSWQAVGPILMGIGAIYHGRANLERARRGR